MEEEEEEKGGEDQGLRVAGGRGLSHKSIPPALRPDKNQRPRVPWGLGPGRGEQAVCRGGWWGRKG